MKPFITLALLLCFTFTFAQNDEKSSAIDVNSQNNYEKVHELRLGAFRLLAGGFLDLSYEYINSTASGLGVSLMLNFDDAIETEKFGIIPYYRFYFGDNPEFKGHGFFVEAFTYFYTGDQDEYYFSQQANEVFEDDSFFDVAPGLAVGSKWINSSGFLFQIKLGIGRNLLSNSPDEFVATGDFYVGYRF
ncbi:hypothetical protein [Psychroflexus sediminis]|uniref:DUF3575 domain-containing protein n=1 Tax=Psychroflexus sediminis TaxID=470826 RepID=A0A1G7USC0_9FLAO|nr:hypothetical protein [Psychroflexus sediminis]SDG49640.1 hypothetical protein SAMN04488027_102215 [Psychroflexus sediminis]